MEEIFVKKYPMWQSPKNKIYSIANQCGVKVLPVAEYRRFIFLVEYKFYVRGTVKKLNNFAKWANVKYKR